MKYYHTIELEPLSNEQQQALREATKNINLPHGTLIYFESTLGRDGLFYDAWKAALAQQSVCLYNDPFHDHADGCPSCDVNICTNCRCVHSDKECPVCEEKS